MVEREVVTVPAILTGKLVAQENVEPREGRMGGWLYEILQRDDARQLHLEARAAHRAFVMRHDIHALEEDGLDRVLPGPERQRVIAQRPKVGVQNQRRKPVWRHVRVHYA